MPTISTDSIDARVTQSRVNFGPHRAGACITHSRVVMTVDQGMSTVERQIQPSREAGMAQHVYELTIEGGAGENLAHAFQDGALSTRPGVTVVRSSVADAAGLHSLIRRIDELGLELVGIRRVAPPRSARPSG